jgi:hypothetical protein
MSIHDPVFADSLSVVLLPPSCLGWKNAAQRVLFASFPIFIAYGVN